MLLAQVGGSREIRELTGHGIAEAGLEAAVLATSTEVPHVQNILVGKAQLKGESSRNTAEGKLKVPERGKACTGKSCWRY